MTHADAPWRGSYQPETELIDIRLSFFWDLIRAQSQVEPVQPPVLNRMAAQIRLKADSMGNQAERRQIWGASQDCVLPSVALSLRSYEASDILSQKETV